MNPAIQPFSLREFSELPVNSGRDRTFVQNKSRKEAEAPPPPTFTEADLEAAKREAYKKGFEAGIQDGRNQAESEQTEINNQLNENTKHFADKIAPLFADYRQLTRQLRPHMPKIGQAIAHKIAGNALEENAQVVIETVAEQCFSAISSEPKITIIVAEKLGDTLERNLQHLASRLQHSGDLVVVRNSAMALSDCRIEWQQGMVERDTEKLWGCVDKAISDISQNQMREHQAQMDLLEFNLTAEPSETNDIT